MRRAHLALFAALTLVPPAAAQDLLSPLQDLVEEFSGPAKPAEAPRRAADPAPSKPATPPPIPRPRPESAAEEAEPPAEEKAEDVAAEEQKPARVYQTACPALLDGTVIGKMLPPIAEGQCVERSPVLVEAVNANGRVIKLASPLTTNCAMASTFADWAGDIDAYAKAAFESPIAEFGTGSSFVCRNRYSAEDGFVSEHGFANAIDLSGFALEDGSGISVKADWSEAGTPAGKFLRQAHGAACGKFTTVLGPEANAEHEDHLHFDLGCHGSTCTAQICE